MFRIVLLAAIQLAFVTAKCPTGWTNLPGSLKCYKGFAERKTFAEADTYCRENFATNAGKIANELDKSCDFWIGLHYNEREGVQMWTDGSYLGFQMWDSGYPTGDIQKRVTYLPQDSRSHKWRSTTVADDRKCFFCQQRPAENDVRISENAAQAFCSAWKANLVSVHSAEENAFLNKLSQGKQYWLGLKYSTKWNWIDGTAMDYMNWNGQVTSGSKDTVCADANEPDFYGKWSKQGCYKRLRSICKQTRMLVAIIL
ncbi:unnamed protein product [Enterobius vermicularis]|uniref:C-type lectin domain-containing protein n=1 Tax=Enterobius vermicularis TaxID=51028 RepID=A0A0N4V5L0_ENTVE|nr:unnamed protein product [Enterobius vermicularis]